MIGMTDPSAPRASEPQPVPPPPAAPPAYTEPVSAAGQPTPPSPFGAQEQAVAEQAPAPQGAPTYLPSPLEQGASAPSAYAEPAPYPAPPTPPPGYGQAGYSGQNYQQAPPQQPYGYPQQPTGYSQQPYGYAPAYDPDAKSRIAAGLFGIFLGVFGVHRFYLGNVGIGLTMLLISVLSFGVLSFVSAIWGLIEGIMILARSTSFTTDATGRPLRD
jgi:TM2 domain-containing membrane protein YozV